MDSNYTMESDKGKRADATHPATGDSTNKTSDSCEYSRVDIDNICNQH